MEIVRIFEATRFGSEEQGVLLTELLQDKK